MTEPRQPAVILIGGGALGSIGEMVGDQLLTLGYKLVVIDKQHTSEQLHPFDIMFLEAELADSSEIEHAAAAAVDLLARNEMYLAGVVYAAGVNHLGSVDELSEARFDDMVTVNAKAVWLFAKALRHNVLVHKYSVVRHSVKTIVLGSNTAFVAKTRSFGYAFSKAGLVHMLRCMHRELAPEGWEFTSLDFGIVLDSAMTEKTVKELGEQRGWGKDEALKMLLRNVPNGKPVTRHEIAATVGFMLRPDIQSFGGSSVRFDGGQQQG